MGKAKMLTDKAALKIKTRTQCVCVCLVLSMRVSLSGYAMMTFTAQPYSSETTQPISHTHTQNKTNQ